MSVPKVVDDSCWLLLEKEFVRIIYQSVINHVRQLAFFKEKQLFETRI